MTISKTKFLFPLNHANNWLKFLQEKRNLFSIISFNLVLIGLFASLFLVQQQQLLKKSATTPQGWLGLPESFSVKVNRTFTIPVMLGTDGAAIVGADLILNFTRGSHPFLELTDITLYPGNSSLKTFLPANDQGNFQKSAIITRANNTGQIEISAIAYNWSTSQKLSGFTGNLSETNPLVSLTFKALKAGETNISFFINQVHPTADSNLARENDAVDILTHKTDLNLTITGSGTTPNPTQPPEVTPTPTTQPPSGNNLILNPNFENGKNNWKFYTAARAIFSIVSPGYQSNHSAKISVRERDANLQLYQVNFHLKPRTRYQLSFAAKSSTGHNLIATIHKHREPYTNFGLYKTFDLSSNWKVFTAEFTTTAKVAADTRLRFWLKPFVYPGDNYFIDKVSLKEL